MEPPLQEVSNPVEKVAGLIERVTYFNEETGFSVLRVKSGKHRDLVTVVGTLPTANAGEWVTAEGNWIRDREHGLQLKASVLRTVPPTTAEGIERYLGSGMVKGIGPVFAKRLVARFGPEVLGVIESDAQQLQTVDGIGPKRRHRITVAWEASKQIREIMIFLHGHGVSTSKSVRIYKAYGAKAIATVKQNPYLLAKEIYGIGFKTADQLAQRLGIPRDSLNRACAGIDHVLLDATSEGHCALPINDLIHRAAQLLEVESGIVDMGLSQMITSGTLLLETVDGEALVFLPHLRYAEQGIATRIKAMAGAESMYPPIQVDRAVEWCESRTGKVLAASQREALQTVLTRRVVIITGGPGVGKTTLVNSILTILRAKAVNCLLCAPTGRAAKRLSESTGLEAKTIHRLLEVLPGTGKFARNESNPLDCDLLVMDETSMVDVVLMSHALRALPARASLILVGDVDQLPSVGPGHVLGDLIDSELVPTVRLTEVFRQAAGSQIITTAHGIRRGRVPEATNGSNSDFFFVERDEPDQIAAVLEEMVQKRIQKRFGFDPIRDVQVLCPMNRGSLGVRELNQQLQRILNPPSPDTAAIEKFGWRFQVRDKVIQTENNYEKEVFNGDIGTIEAIDRTEQEVGVRFDDRLVTYDFGEMDELSLAYAVTIHKAQGSEFPVVVIPIATQHYTLLQRNLIYTGITRGRSLVVVVGQKKAFALAVRNSRSQKRYSGLLDCLRSLRDNPAVEGTPNSTTPST